MSNPFSITNTKRSSTGQRQLVSAHLPQGLVDYLATYAVWRGVAKQIILQDIAEAFAKKEMQIEQILVILSNRAVSAWHTRWRENIDKKGWKTDEDETRRLEEFCTEMRKTLTTRGVPKGYISKILGPLTKDQ